MKKFIALVITFTLSAFPFSPFSNFLLAQTKKQSLTNTILAQDSLFWIAYNQCDVERMQQFFTNDVEFYHDKGGLTLGLENLIIGLRKNLCGNENFKLRRESIEGSVKVFPLQSAEVTYGAIISGEHIFYVLENGKEERLDGYGKFSDVWVLRGNVWKMSRILSYDHGPAPYINHRKVKELTAGILDQFVGQYIAPQTGICNVQRENDSLHLVIGDQNLVLYPESNMSFFLKDRDLAFEFTKNEKGNVSTMIVRENGKIVEEAKKK